MDRLTDVFGRDNNPVLKCLCEYEMDGSICDTSVCSDYCKQFCKNSSVADCDKCGIQQAIDRLTAYEDTGLTPEEIIKMKANHERRQKLLEEAISTTKKMRQKDYEPCPDCGNDFILTDNSYFGICPKCGHTGKPADSPKKAIKSWNEREREIEI